MGVVEVGEVEVGVQHRVVLAPSHLQALAREPCPRRGEPTGVPGRAHEPAGQRAPRLAHRARRVGPGPGNGLGDHWRL